MTSVLPRSSRTSSLCTGHRIHGGPNLKGLIGATDDVTTSFVAEVFPNLANLVEPLVWTIAVAYWAVLGIQTYNGKISVAPWDIVKRAMLTFMVFLTLNWSTGIGALSDLGTWTETIAAQIMSRGVDSTSMLDALYVNVGQVASTLMNVSWRQFGMIIMGSGLFAVNCILLSLQS